MSPSPHTVSRDLLGLSVKRKPGLLQANTPARKTGFLLLGLLALCFISNEAHAASDTAVLISSFILSHTILVVLLVLLYFLPWLIAYFRGHHNTLAIFALNVLLGWTFIGWVIAFVWALTATHTPVAIGLDGSYQSTDRPSSVGGVVIISLVLAGIVGATYVYYSERIRQANATKGAQTTSLDQPRTSGSDGSEKSEIQRAFKSAYDGTDTLDNRDNIVYAPAKLILVDGSTYALISEGTGVDCFGCFGALLITYLTKDGGNFRARTPRIEKEINGSPWGQPPTWKVMGAPGNLAMETFSSQVKGGDPMGCWNAVHRLLANEIRFDFDATRAARKQHGECDSWDDQN